MKESAIMAIVVIVSAITLLAAIGTLVLLIRYVL